MPWVGKREWRCYGLECPVCETIRNDVRRPSVTVIYLEGCCELERDRGFCFWVRRRDSPFLNSERPVCEAIRRNDFERLLMTVACHVTSCKLKGEIVG